eukprot:scaffold28606_cov118-Isochrysis_galbana.AAC.8
MGRVRSAFTCAACCMCVLVPTPEKTAERPENEHILCMRMRTVTLERGMPPRHNARREALRSRQPIR